VIALVAGVRARGRLLAPLDGLPSMQAAFWGALVAVVAGAFTNDSGPVILIIGTVYLALAAGYFASEPIRDAGLRGPEPEAGQRRW
jgi:hypothetical protein